MRLMVTIFLLVVLVIVDQFRFRGHYGSELSRLMVVAVKSVTDARAENPLLPR